MRKLTKAETREIKQHEDALYKLVALANSGFLKGVLEHGANSNLKMDLPTEIKSELRDIVCYTCFVFEHVERLQKLLRRLK